MKEKSISTRHCFNARDSSSFLVQAGNPLASYHSGWMTWTQDSDAALSSLALAWLGFVDVHSAIDYYLITVGSSYGGKQLTPVCGHGFTGIELDKL